MTSNKSSNSSFGSQTPKLNFFLVSIQKCSESNPTVYCKYSASLITFGHLCLLFYFPLMFYRMSKLGNRFRNHYNLSFLWLCSLILMFSIDILEFLVTHDQNLYSMVIISATILNITLGFIFSFKYIRTYSKDGVIYKQILTIAFSVSLFVIIIVARVITRKSLLKINKYDQETYTKVNTHLFLYYFVFILFGFAQVHQNIRNNFARTMTNSSYALWILGSFFFIFYSSILPIDPAYDFIHLRNYFLLTTLIVIISQDIYFYRQKKSLDNRLNGFMLKNIKPDMQTNLASNPSKQEKILKFTDNVFNDEVFFDVRNYKNKSELNKTLFDLKDNISDTTEDNDIANKEKRLKLFIKSNQQFLLVIFSLILGIQFLISTGLMFTSVSSPVYRYFTLVIHPLIVLTSVMSNYVSKNFRNQSA